MQNEAPYRNNPSIKYNDIYFRIVACLVASHIMVAYGETMSMFKMLLIPYYYYALIPSFVIAMILFATIRTITMRLDRKLNWYDHTASRAGIQLFLGLVIPAIIAFLLAAMYFTSRGVNLFETTYIQYDFQFILLQLLLINLYYVAYYFYQKWSHAEKMISELVSRQQDTVVSQKDTFMVNKGAGNIVLQMDEIAYFYRNNETNYLRTVKGEDFFINISLDEAQQQLDENKFFRANRQLIIHRQACKGFNLLTFGKLDLQLHPFLDMDTVVSQKRSRDFKNWLEN